MLKVVPQGHFLKRLAGKPGPWLGGSSRLPASHAAYFAAVKVRSSRHASKSASVHFGR
jgi:hypothetical protein